MTVSPYDLDVRPILRNGGEPLGAVMAAVAALAPGQSLRLLAPFKPVPLFQVLASRGFEPSAREIGASEWEVIFTPTATTARETDPNAAASGAGWPEPLLEMDNRDLDPPEPMVRTLRAVEILEPGQTLAALLPREPLFLFEELQRRGHKWRGSLEADGSYRIVIRASISGGPRT
ncbi:DUF2249 domain-containing protein [Phyllobacterium phragmitis]|uniref:DUF2249 domain-containing protein n=1 Tax=Phyllobacterium phragmitis TaxID=2670329 RepID=A0ABQ0H2C3_9HYPH